MTKGTKQSTPLSRTRKELWRQVVLGLLLYALLGTAFIVTYPRYALGIFATLVLLGGALIYAARRAIWFCLWRAIVFVFAFGIGGISIATPIAVAAPPDRRWLVVLSLCGVVVVGSAAYFFVWIVPHWRDTYAQNVKRKINLDKATFSIITPWAVRTPVTPAGRRWIIAAGILGPLLGIYVSHVGGVQMLVESVLSVVLLFAALSMSLIELYNAYQLRLMEHAINRSIIIDVYKSRTA